MKLKFWCHKYDNTLIWFDYFGPSEPPQPRQWFGLSAGAARIFLWTSYMAQKNHMHSIRSRVPSDANETCECLHSTIPINLEKTNVCPNFSSMYQVNEHNQDFFSVPKLCAMHLHPKFSWLWTSQLGAISRGLECNWSTVNSWWESRRSWSLGCHSKSHPEGHVLFTLIYWVSMVAYCWKDWFKTIADHR